MFMVVLEYLEQVSFVFPQTSLLEKVFRQLLRIVAETSAYIYIYFDNNEKSFLFLCFYFPLSTNRTFLF